MRRPRSLSPEEAQLWRQLVAGVKPLRAGPPREQRPPPLVTTAPLIPTDPLPPPSPLRRPNGVDGQTLRQLAKGDRPVEATIDLHGMTLDRAHDALSRFIARQAALQRRCLLVITGKGDPDRPGRLRQDVPRWLEGWKPPVLAVVPATARHGGGGAFYVLLQRRR